MLYNLLRKFRKLIKWLFILFIFFTIVFFILNLIFPLPKDKLERDKSVMVYDRDGKLLRAYTSNDGMWRMHTDLDDVPTIMKKTLIAYEDKRFYNHFGVDPFAMVRAILSSIKRGEIVSGFSTITMQLARMIEPKERTIWSKLVEIFRAIQIELTYSKNDILELYFNIAPYGGNIEGIGAASYIYFGKPYTQLSIGEIATLIGLPNSPTSYRPDKYPEKAKEQRNKILRMMYQKNIINKNRYEEALVESIPNKRYAIPFSAPHISDHLKMINKDKYEINSTIDLSTQQICEEILKKHSYALKQKAINNGAIVVIDNSTREVVALVGSANYFDNNNQGQVNGAISLRSPGSALKPFVYVLAAEEGLIGSETMLVDLPENFSGFEPQNYDKKYRGVVTASQALALSLNIPAVQLMRDLKRKSLYNKLKEGGITTLTKGEDYYGLSLILGGSEVMLLELTNLYSTLANEGIYKKYSLELNQKNLAKRIFTREASYLISEMLAEDHYISKTINWKTSLGQHKIAWKTGTSYAHRDAWSIGYDRYYTVGVWIGNFDNKESPDIVGIDVATPLMFDIFKGITKETNPKWLDKPSGIDTRMVSTASGKLPNEWDNSTKPELYIKGVTSEEKDNIRQQILIDKKTKYRLYYHCLSGKDYETKVLSIYPGKVRTWMELNGFPVDTIPEAHPDCTLFIGENGPKIDSPSNNAVYYIKGNIIDKEQQIVLRAHPEKGNKTVYWFIDDFPFGSSLVGEDLIYTPKKGEHTLIAMDEEGRTSKIKFNVVDVNDKNDESSID